jgi:Tol biopolymer transport system component
MQRDRYTITVSKTIRLLAVVGLLATITFALGAPPDGKGGGGGRPGGGGEDPPADPAIVYIDSRKDDIKVMNADGSSQTVVVPGVYSQPTMSGDGSLIVFGGEIAGIPGIYTVRSDGTDLQLIVPTVNTRPDLDRAMISPVPAADGADKIAFNDQGILWLMNLDGSDLHELTYTDGTQISGTYPAWSIDGTRLAVRLGGDLVVLDLGLVDGVIQVVSEFNLFTVPGSPLTNASSLAFPSWANTQDVIVFSARFEQANHDMYLIDLADPLSPIQLTFTDTGDRWASFSPDDAFIIYHDNSAGILQMDAWLNTTRLTRHGWRPHRRRFDPNP